MKILISALALVTLIAVPAFAHSVAASAKVVRDSNQSPQDDLETPSECAVKLGWRLIKCDQPPGEVF